MYLTIILKTFVLYMFVILVYRIMGKKEVGQLSIIDLIVSILIAELVALSIEDNQSSIFVSVVPILVLVISQLILSYFSMKSSKLREFIDGKPTMIIKDGKIKFNEMSKLRYNLEDLIMQLREQGVKSIEEVDYAVLENNGKLSVFEKNSDYPLPLILDGIVDYTVLREIKKDINWLNKTLDKNNLKLEDVFYAFYTKRKTFIIKKSELI